MLLQRFEVRGSVPTVGVWNWFPHLVLSLAVPCETGSVWRTSSGFQDNRIIFVISIVIILGVRQGNIFNVLGGKVLPASISDPVKYLKIIKIK